MVAKTRDPHKGGYRGRRNSELSLTRRIKILNVSEYNKGIRLVDGQGFPLRKCASETHCLAEKLKRDAKRQGEQVLSGAHGFGW